MKIVINACFGGFGLSEKAVKLLEEKGCDRRVERNDPRLVEVVEQLGDEANDRFSKLKVVEIPDDIDWNIDEYDGWESVEEKHRKWY